MPLLHVLVLAVVQGITEFLPISSSAHLILTWEAFDALGQAVPQQSEADRLILDIAAHVGTLMAVCLYFRRDLEKIARGTLALASGERSPQARLALNLVLASLPLLAAGLLLYDAVSEYLRDCQVIAWTTIVFGVALYGADRWSMQLRRAEELSVGQALFVGIAHALALIPGTSRAGITMTAGRLLGLDRPEAARFSMLLAVPAILGAGSLASLDLYHSGNARLGVDALFAAALSFGAALAAIALLLRWLQRASFTPFVIYRLCLGGVLLWLIHAYQFCPSFDS